MHRSSVLFGHELTEAVGFTSMGRRDFLVKRAVPVLIVVTAVVLLFVVDFVIAPTVARVLLPGPTRSRLGWPMLAGIVSAVAFVIFVLTCLAAWNLSRHGRFELARWVPVQETPLGRALHLKARRGSVLIFVVALAGIAALSAVAFLYFLAVVLVSLLLPLATLRV